MELKYDQLAETGEALEQEVPLDEDHEISRIDREVQSQENDQNNHPTELVHSFRVNLILLIGIHFTVPGKVLPNSIDIVDRRGLRENQSQKL